jgi:hypothetical protein
MDVLAYCKDCQSRNSWVRNPARDIKDINGKPFEYGYKCAVWEKLRYDRRIRLAWR